MNDFRDIKKALFQNNASTAVNRKASVNVSRNPMNMMTVQENPSGGLSKDLLPKLSAHNKFHLPGLGRTVSHTMTHASAQNSRFKFDPEDVDDPKVMD